MDPIDTENNAYAKFWSDKQRALWYVMVFSGVVNCIFTKLTFDVVSKPCYHLVLTCFGLRHQ